jgi:hypothetical protein
LLDLAFRLTEDACKYKRHQFLTGLFDMAQKHKKRKKKWDRRVNANNLLEINISKDNLQDNFKSGILSFVQSKSFFDKFNLQEKKDYLERISKFDLSSRFLKSNWKKIFGENDYFLDERIVGYSPGPKLSVAETLFIGSTAVVPFLIVVVIFNWHIVVNYFF